MLRPDNTAVLLVDVQGRLAHLINGHEAMIRRQRLLLEAAKVLDLPIVWAEQVPDKLGHTVPELAECLSGQQALAKSSFGCMNDTALRENLATLGRRQILVAGIEAHVCVYQSVSGLLSEGFEAYLALDAIGSQRAIDYQVGVRRMEMLGAIPVSVEMVLFELMQDARHPDFRRISSLLKASQQAEQSD